MLERPPGRPFADQFVESTPHAEGKQISRSRDQLGSRPAGGGAKQEAGVKSRRRHTSRGEPLRAVTERRLNRLFAQRFSAESGEAPG